jgi:hypothetical protein
MATRTAALRHPRMLPCEIFFLDVARMVKPDATVLRQRTMTSKIKNGRLSVNAAQGTADGTLSRGLPVY